MPPPLGTESMMHGRYRLIERIGAGGMATVWRARDEALGRDVAIKVFTVAATTTETVRQQELEAKTAARLTHHGLVTLLDAGVDEDPQNGDRIFLVMELVLGDDLKVHLENEELSPRDIAYIGHDLAEALEFLHHNGIVHRDIKPANILISEFRGGAIRPRAKLTDFGIARRADDQTPADGTTTGTAAYLSPEQANLERVGPPSDIYSLGLVLLECFTRQLAFPGDVAHSALSRLVRDPDVPADLDPEWRILLSAMTARDPALRPSASEAMLTLRDLVISSIGRRRRSEEQDAPPVDRARASAFTPAAGVDLPFSLRGPLPDSELDRITAVASRVLGAAAALITIPGHERVWVAAKPGVRLNTVAGTASACAAALLRDDVWVIEDAASDPRSLTNPLLGGALMMQSYAGVPLATSDGVPYGTLCVLNMGPRGFSEDEISTLVDLASVANAVIEKRAPSERASAEV
jgi:GAF domain-containing protein